MSDIDRLFDSLFEALDWSRLGAIYCDEGGEAFWAARRKSVLKLGRAWGRALVARLPAGGTSLYVGAGVAELPAMLIETRELGRRVVASNLRAEECAVLDAGLRAVEVLPEELSILPVDARTLLGRGPFDHLAVVSALTDPETWPVVSAVTYGRMPPVVLDLTAFAAEREAILALTSSLCAALALPAWITTTGDETPWFVHVARARGLELQPDDEMIETAVVGDPIGFLRVANA